MSGDNRDFQRALMAAYTEVTGIELPLDYQRRVTLNALDKKGLTPDDMRAVMKHLKSLVESADPRYTETSLLFSNAVGKRDQVQKFEERALLLRRKRKKSAGSGPKPAAAPASEAEQDRIRAAAKLQAAELKARLRGGQAS